MQRIVISTSTSISALEDFFRVRSKFVALPQESGNRPAFEEAVSLS